MVCFFGVGGPGDRLYDPASVPLVHLVWLGRHRLEYFSLVAFGVVLVNGFLYVPSSQCLAG